MPKPKRNTKRDMTITKLFLATDWLPKANTSCNLFLLCRADLPSMATISSYVARRAWSVAQTDTWEAYRATTYLI